MATLLALKGMIPAKTRETARMVVRKVVNEVEQRLSQSLRDAVKGAVDRSTRSLRPKLREIDWDRTIRANLKTWDPEHRILIPERVIGHGRKGRGLKHVVLCVDQSGSMATSVVYAGIFGAVLASIRALTLSMAVFDTDVADLSAHLDDPVELLFSTQVPTSPRRWDGCNSKSCVQATPLWCSSLTCSRVGTEVRSSKRARTSWSTFPEDPCDVVLGWAANQHDTPLLGFISQSWFSFFPTLPSLWPRRFGVP